MSVQAITAALAIQGVSPTEKLVLIVLANYADEKLTLWPSQARLSRDTCMHVRSIIRVLARLEKLGLLERKHRPHREDGSRNTDIMRLKIHGDKMSPRCADHGDTVSPTMVTFTTNHGDTVSPKPSIEPLIEPSTRGRARDDPKGRASPAERNPAEKAEVAAMMRELANSMRKTA